MTTSVHGHDSNVIRTSSPPFHTILQHNEILSRIAIIKTRLEKVNKGKSVKGLMNLRYRLSYVLFGTGLPPVLCFTGFTEVGKVRYYLRRLKI